MVEGKLSIATLTHDGCEAEVVLGENLLFPWAEQFIAWNEPGETELVYLIRTKQDMCEAYLPEGQLLHFTWTQLGVTKGSARLVNPIDKLALK